MRLNKYELRRTYSLIRQVYCLIGEEMPEEIVFSADGAELMDVYYEARKVFDAVNDFSTRIDYLTDKIRNSNRRIVKYREEGDYDA